MSFDFSKWASQSLAKIEGTLDQAFGLESTEPQAAAPLSLPSIFVLPSTPSPRISESVSEQKTSEDNSNANISENPVSISAKQPADNNHAETENRDSNASKVSSPKVFVGDPNDHESEQTSDRPLASESRLRFLLEQREDQCKEQSKQLASLHAEKIDLEMKLSEATLMGRELRDLVNELSAKEPNALQNELHRTKTQLRDLLLEGEQWSKRQMKLEGVVKNLRKDIKAKDTEISALCSDAEKKAKVIQDLTEKCHDQEETEKELLERIAGLTGTLNETKAELERMKQESVLLDKETIESVAVTERLEAKLRAQQIEAAHWKVAFDEQSELHARLSVMQDQLKEGELREETLRRNFFELSAELKYLKDGADEERLQLRQQLELAREQLDRSLSQNEQLRQEIPLATQPLLKQIATLQASLKSQTQKLESTESKLLNQLEHAKKSLERRKNSMDSFESNLIEAQKANEDLTANLETAAKQNEKLRFEIAELRESTETLRGRLVLKEQHCDALHKQLTFAQNDAQENLKKVQEQMAFAEANSLRLQKELEETRSAFSQLKSNAFSPNQDGRTDVVRKQRSREIPDLNIENLGGNDENKISVLAYAMNPQLRRQEAELASLRERLLEIENDRDNLAEKLVEASVRSNSDSESIRSLQEQLDALNVRHDIALNIIGEKTDQVDELKADLKECKAIFKEQLEMLLRQQQGQR